MRINFSLFKLGEVTLRRLYAQGQQMQAMKSLKLLFDLFKVQLYYVMLCNRASRAIMGDIAEKFQLLFLKDIVDKTERGEFNCQLCHTLNKMFALTKSPGITSPEYLPFLSKVQEEIYQMLTLICNHTYEPVDQTHHLKVFFLLFL